MNKKWIFIVIFLVVLFLFTSFIAAIVSLFVVAEKPVSGNVALIPVTGILLSDGAGFFDQDISSAADIIRKIERADEAENVKAIIFEINSPGGTVVASEEIVNAVKAADKPTVAYIREVGASGAYWIASASDYILSSRFSMLGSVGVVASYLEFSGLLQDYNVTYQRLVSGKYKDLGSPFKEMTYEEQQLFEHQLSIIHDYFVEDVAENRNLTEEALEEISTARLYLGVEAKDIGLIDSFGGRQEAIEHIEHQLNITAEVNEMITRRTFLDVIGTVMNEKSYFIGKGIGSAFTQKPGPQLWT